MHHSLLLNYINNLQKVNGTFIEVGSTRDQGSTFDFACLIKSKGGNFITIDPSEEVVLLAKKMLQKIDIKFRSILSIAEDFLETYNKVDICVAYLDGFDIVTDWPHKKKTIDFYTNRGIDLLKDGNKLSAESHLKITKLILKKSTDDLILGFDDTWYEESALYCEWKGKGATAVPYLINEGFEILGKTNAGVILKRK